MTAMTMHKAKSKAMLAGLIATATAFCYSAALQAQQWSYAEAAKPYAGTTIRVLDEITPLQETMRRLVPEFVEETGIQVEYELLSHGDVINRGQADLFSGRGHYDAIMLHGLQLGPLLAARVLQPIDGLKTNSTLTNPDLGLDDLIEPANESLVNHGGSQYGFLTWNYNQIYWARADLLNHPDEKAAFEARYGYPLAPAETMQQMRDIAEFFTRKSGEALAGETLRNDFYGIVLEGIPGGTTFTTVWEVFMNNWGGGVFDANGKPQLDAPENIAAVQFWADLWKFAPPGQAEYSLIDVPTVMGNGIAAQSIAFSDFVLGVDRPDGGTYAGQFVYGGIPANADLLDARSAGGEPSLMALSSHSKKPEATYLFMQWMVDKQTQAKLLEMGGGGVPIRRSSFDLDVMREAERQSLYKAMAASLEYVQAKPKTPNFFDIDNIMGPLVQQVGIGRLSAEDALKEGQRQVSSLCSSCLLTD
ncbi:extracellular solute-binding protein [Marinobacter sp. tcs-11]|uniref:extracellular solute-binding protein n=1 Tax=Marinobacter sp. tcs-11 TaxID=1742860 RepID=UPI00257FE0FD|nr:extracellular solute-binding protein [Marinobacter sp. tcs-11]